jgi:leucyl/phenylalanyl-tRNA--protein transferase
MEETKLFWIAANKYDHTFPPISEALTDPDGLLAAGGDLNLERLLDAYRHGIFPWFDHTQPVLWWSPDPRTILYPGLVHVSRSLKKTLKKMENKNHFTITFNQAFSEVIAECSEPRGDDRGTWLTPEMIDAYINLHRNNHAHSIECWQDDRLVGGLYGVSVGRVFFGESMFSRVTDASKVCLVKLSDYLKEWNYDLIDCQIESEHLGRMGAEQITRENFAHQLDQSCQKSPAEQAWTKEIG